jgi:ATP-dependent DNA helicase RecG
VSTRLALAGFAGLDQGVPRARPEADLRRPVGTLKGVGPKMGERLGRLGIGTVGDLLEHAPRAYLDWSEAASFRDLAAGEEATIRCTLVRIRVRPTRRRNLKIVEGVVVDAAGVRETAVWFNQQHLAKLAPGTELLLHGTRDAAGGFRVARHELGGSGLHTVGLVPEYPASEDIPSYRLRALVEEALPAARFLGDPIPARVLAQTGLPGRADALAAVHRPARREEAELGRARLAFEELLVLQLVFGARRRAAEDAGRAPALGEPGELLTRYREALPFRFTPDQEAAVRQIDGDLARSVPMQRLLQGDVGSGKTVVALYALLRAAERGHQGALMAPTETLAEQHFLTVAPLCAELGVAAALLTGSVKGAINEAQIVVGTHALIQEGVAFRSLAVAVVDEQHRFGVEQRRALGSSTPHVLHMTATPIPRTLAQTVYGDLDVTEISHLPAGRKPIVTRWVTHERSAEAYRRLRRHLEEGRQAYVVCPLVSESEAIEARAAEQEAKRLRRAELRGLRVGCLHGRLKTDERRAVMDEFKRGELDVLVATTVIEVGVDVPNATIMIVQEADRFGLAQLHQLRGRVGRGGEQSYCLLVSRPREELTDAARRRLEALVEASDGFELAEVDLELRGEGQLLGTRQSGLPDLKFASLTRDRDLLARAREWAETLAEERSPVVELLRRRAEQLDENHRGFA